MIRIWNKTYVYWCSLNRIDGKDNFGDILGKYLVEKISNKKMIRVLHPSMRRYKLFIKHYLTVGSILDVANTNSIVWGSGIIRRMDIIRKAKFLAVRGPITRERLMELGYNVPQLYGDPAILLPKFYSKIIEKKYQLGIIPHYVDYEYVCKNLINNNNNMIIINLLTKDVEEVINEILKCKFIVSSSLHGVIVAHAYGIPALWVKFSNNLGGDNIKFYDYFESVNINYKSELNVKSENLNLDYLLNLLKEYEEVILPSKEVMLKREQDLLKSNPF